MLHSTPNSAGRLRGGCDLYTAHSFLFDSRQLFALTHLAHHENMRVWFSSIMPACQRSLTPAQA